MPVRFSFEAPIKCPVAMISLLVRDMKVVRKRAANRAASFKKRQILRRASCKNIARPKKKIAKKSKSAEPIPVLWEKWPVLRPFDLMRCYKEAGLESELCPR